MIVGFDFGNRQKPSAQVNAGDESLPDHGTGVGEAERPSHGNNLNTGPPDGGLRKPRLSYLSVTPSQPFNRFPAFLSGTSAHFLPVLRYCLAHDNG